MEPKPQMLDSQHPQSPGASRRRSLLILDDDKASCQQLQVLLTRFRDWCDIEECHEGLQAQQFLTNRPADLVFIDPRLPDCNGQDLIQAILQENPETDIVVVVPPGLESAAQRALEAGAVGVLVKPCQASELEEIVSHCLGIRVGLRGDVEGISLSDLVQLIHSKKWDRTVAVTASDGKVGRIYFRRGEIQHAETEMLIGIDAFNSILKWPQGRFEIRTGCASSDISVEIPTMQLLLDGLRKSDEGAKDLNSEIMPPEDEIGALFDSMMVTEDEEQNIDASAMHGLGHGHETAKSPSLPHMPAPHAAPPNASEKLESALNLLRSRWDLSESCAIVNDLGFVLAGVISQDIPDSFWSQLFGVTGAFFDDTGRIHKRGLFREAILQGAEGGLAVLTIPRTSCFLVSTLKAGSRLGLILSGLHSVLEELADAILVLQR